MMLKKTLPFKLPLTLVTLVAVFTLAACDSKSVAGTDARKKDSPAWFAKNKDALVSTITQCSQSIESELSADEKKACDNARAAVKDLGVDIVQGYNVLSIAKEAVSQQIKLGVKQAPPLPKLEAEQANVVLKHPVLHIDPNTGVIQVELANTAYGISLYTVPTIEGELILLENPFEKTVKWTCYSNVTEAEFLLIPKECRTSYSAAYPIKN